MKNTLQRIVRKGRQGQGLVEYVLIIGLILFIAIAVVGKLGGTVKGKFESTNTQMETEFNK